MNITITFDPRGATRDLQVAETTLRQSTLRILDRTILAVRDEASRRFATQLGFTPAQAAKYTRTESASFLNPAARLLVRDLFPQARKLSPTQTGTGVAVTVPGVFATELRHAFIAKMRTGSVGVFRRTTRPAQRRGPKRSYLPIKQQVVQVPAFLPAGLEAFARARLEAEAQRELSTLRPRLRPAA